MYTHDLIGMAPQARRMIGGIEVHWVLSVSPSYYRVGSL